MRTSTRLTNIDSTTGDGGALDDLERDHRRVETLFAHASAVRGPARARAVQLLAHALSTHAELEEQVVYPAIETALETAGWLVERSRGEHDTMKTLLARLASADDVDAPHTVEDLRELQLVVMQHVAVEEGELFPAFRRVAGAAARRDLDAAADEARAQAPPPPTGASRSLAGALVDAVTGAVTEAITTVHDAVEPDTRTDEGRGR